MLRRIKPLERDIQAGVLDLLRLMPEVAWAHKVPVGEWVIVRPRYGPDGEPESVRAQLKQAVGARILSHSQIGFIQGAPEGTLDIALQLKGIGTHCELEVKQPGQNPSKEQFDRMSLIRENKGFAWWVYDIDQVQDAIMNWRRVALGG
jgi:hypothetical protein